MAEPMTAPRPAPPLLLADVGGTKARFALALGDGSLADPLTLDCASFPDLTAAVLHYLDQATAAGERPRRAAIAVAAPVTGDEVALTNHPWRFSIAELKQRLDLDRLVVINDFAALALAVPRLTPDDRLPVGGGTPAEGEPIGVIGPGTGLGVAGLVPVPGGMQALATEGGHVTMAAADDRESAVLAVLRQRFGHASAERVLSGDGLVNLYQALATLERAPAEDLSPAKVGARALGGGSPLCAEALDLFFAMLGTAAGNLALTLGARGGIYVAGGIVPQYAARFATSAFRQRFEDKGRYRSYLAAIPSYLVIHPAPGFLGLEAALERDAMEGSGDD
ncbi:MAG: glucokinase [Kiloniellales bacterium]